MKKEARDKAIQEIMDEFNWARVKACMDLLNWEWADTGVPTLCDLKKHARELLEDVVKEKPGTSIGTGGFVARYSIDERGIPEVSLKFILTEWYTECE